MLVTILGYKFFGKSIGFFGAKSTKPFNWEDLVKSVSEGIHLFPDAPVQDQVHQKGRVVFGVMNAHHFIIPVRDQINNTSIKTVLAKHLKTKRAIECGA